MPAAAILGAQWGDEGKGKIVDLFAGSADIVARFQGGPNAGHTIRLSTPSGPTKLVLHHIPSGLLHEGTHAVMADGMVIDPETFLAEVDQLRDAGFEVSPDRLHLAYDATVVLPIHRAIDRAREENRHGGQIGTTLRGVGPAYEDRTARRAVRFRDLLDDEVLAQRLGRLLFERNAALAAYGAPTLDPARELEAIRRWRDRVLPFCAETRPLLSHALSDGRRVLFEGAQGALLDLALGTFPFVTSSHTTTGGIFVGTGISPSRLTRVVGVTKAYVTRVGAGPFPTELLDDDGKRLARRGVEFGATTGRPRRCGWLDLVALRHAAETCAFTSFAVTKLDVLSGFEQIRLCHAYRVPSGHSGDFPSDPEILAAAEPEWETLAGWDDDLEGCTRLEQLPSTARALLDRITEHVGVPIGVVSVGADRAHSIVVSDPLWS